MKLEKLDAIRGFAAVYVVIHHLFGFTPVGPLLGSTIRFPFRFGQEAVILFFLLSGFVIYLSVHKSSKLSFKAYLKKRFRRVYPLAVFSFLLSFLIAHLNKTALGLNDLRDLLGNVLMLQDINNKPGNWFMPFLGNLPLWSLSYEWVFYIIFFPIYKFLPKSNRIYLVFLISAFSWISYLAYPNHISLVLSYLIIWWAGLESAAVYVREKNFTLNNIKHILISLFLMVMLSAIPVIKAVSNNFADYNFQVNQISFPIVTFRHFLFGFLVMLIGLTWWKLKLVLFDKSIGIFCKIAPISYGIYILHFPIYASLNMNGFSENLFFVLLVKTLILIGLSYILEIKVQPLVNQYLFK
jgi:peptidoglycan/LPS O-acetylase OafA/YrhL